MKNPYAPPVVQGIPGAAGVPGRYVDLGWGYSYSVTLTASQLLTNQAKSILSDADFVLRAVIFSSTGAFAIRLYDGDNYALSDGLVQSQNLTNTPGDPFPFFPEIWYPAGGKILLDIQDTSVAGNTINILFMGASRYRLGAN